jgi:hypothetical protein
MSRMNRTSLFVVVVAILNMILNISGFYGDGSLGMIISIGIVGLAIINPLIGLANPKWREVPQDE